MTARCALFVRATFSDDRFASDDCRLISYRLGRFDRRVNFGHVVPIGRECLPTIGFKSFESVFTVGQVGRTINLDGVVVPKHNQLA